MVFATGSRSRKALVSLNKVVAGPVMRVPEPSAVAIIIPPMDVDRTKRSGLKNSPTGNRLFGGCK